MAEEGRNPALPAILILTMTRQGYDNDSFILGPWGHLPIASNGSGSAAALGKLWRTRVCDAPDRESPYHETQLALQVGYLDFLDEFYGMATGVGTAPIGLVGNSKDRYQKNERFSELAWEFSFVA